MLPNTSQFRTAAWVVFAGELEDFTGLASLGDIVEVLAVEVPLHRPGACTALPAVPACAAFAAVRMTSMTRSGWESIGTWLLSSS